MKGDKPNNRQTRRGLTLPVERGKGWGLMYGIVRDWLRHWTASKGTTPRLTGGRRATRGGAVRRSLVIEALEARDTPATITVNNPGDRAVGPFNPADVTLRDAVARTAALGGADNIVFAAGITTVTLTGAGTDPFTELPLNQDVTIDGTTTGSGRVVVQTTVAKRIFDVSVAGSDVFLLDLNLQNGNAGIGIGGAISISDGTVDIRRVDISNSTAFFGGGIGQSGGVTTLNTVVLNNNIAFLTGGGIQVLGGALDMTNVNFTGNSAGAVGGGLYASAGAYTQTGGTFSGNQADEGGAFYVDNGGTFNLSSATVSNNTAATRGGGGVVNSAGVLIADAVVFGGINAGDGNSSPFGAALTSSGALTLTRITVARNTASGVNNAAIRIDNGAVTITNSTISNNSAATGLSVGGGTTRVINSTFAFNSGSGATNAGGTLITGNSLYSNNSGTVTGSITSLGNNLFSDGGPAGVVVSDLRNTNPLLLALAVNGASIPSFTNAFQPTSLAFNGGNSGNASGSTDQRGSIRIASGIVDIGAYELLDTIAPTATLSTPPNINATGAASATTTVVVTYADPVGSGLEVTSGVNSGTFGTNDILVSNGATVTGFFPIGNTVFYTVQAPGGTWGTSTQGTYTVTVVAGNVRDFALNGVPSSSTSFIVDTNGPTAVLTTPPANIDANAGGTSTNNFTVTYTDGISGIDVSTIGNGDLIATNGATTATVSLVSVISTPTTAFVTYRVNSPNATWDASPQGTYTIALLPGSVLDNFGNPVAGNPNFASFNVSTIRPFATMTTQPANITVANATPGTNSFVITYTTLGAPLNPASYGSNDVTITNEDGVTTLTVISVANSSNAVTYVIQAPGGMWTNMPQGLYRIALNANSVFDITGNAVAANPTIGFFTVDAFRPTATMPTPPPNITASYAGPQSNTFTINYADVGLGVDSTTLGTSNITVTNGATTLTVATAMVGTPVAGVYPVTYTVLAPGGNWATAPTGTYTVSIVGNNVKDLAGNGISANNNFAFFIVDLTRPTAVLTTPPVNINAANATPAPKTFTITYSDTGTGMNPATFIPANVTVTSGAITIPVTLASASGNVVTYTMTPPGAWGTGTAPNGTYNIALNASAADFAGNTVLAVASLATFTVDVTAPTVAVTPTGTITNASPIVFTIDFSEPVTGLTTAGITVTGGTAGALTQVTTSQYTLPVTPTADGIVTVTVNAGAAQDASGNPSTVSNVASVTSDRTGPTTTFGTPSPTTTTAGPVTFGVTWTDPNFASATLTPGQVILNATGTAGGTVSSVVVTGNTAVITVTNTYGNGNLSISLPAGVAVDTLGNASLAAGPSAPVAVSGNRILTLSQPAAPATLMPGSTYIYAIDYSNTGNQISPNARINVTLPTAGVFVSASSTTGWTNIGGAQYQYSLGNLGIGASGRLLFAVNYPAKTPPGTVATFTATITDTIAMGSPVATSTVSSLIVNPNRLRWGRCC